MKDWDAAYRTQVTPWDKGRPSPVLETWLRGEPDGEGRRALVPGCGAGHDAALLAERGWVVTGVDISATAVAQARTRHGGFGGSCRFLEADLFAHEGIYDLVVEHTCFCALDPKLRVAYRDKLASWLASGGRLAGVFFINPDMAPGEAGPPFGIEEDEVRDLFERDFRIDSWTTPKDAFPGREGRERLGLLTRL